MHLADLGERICILGPSNSGKSTLAEAIARKRNLKAIHLDQLYHLPNTDWEPRPTEEFLALHDKMIAGDRWIMEGNYSSCLPQRLVRATGVIVLDISTMTSLFRYMRRTLFERHRVGALEGRKDSLKWDMIRYIVVTTPGNRYRQIELYRQIGLPKIRLRSVREINEQHREWDL
ncbi:AAA family ATPase [Dyella sp. 20L07]|uniref:AAA family ATPase n=1 Tax=Dyella sp. 20L07 TaxID=3384240 RepID=UPI003D27A446